MPRRKVTQMWWQSPLLQAIGLVLVGVVITAALMMPKGSVDPRSDASEGDAGILVPTPQSVLWPSTPLTIGDVPNGFILPSGYGLFNFENSWLTLMRPTNLPYATRPTTFPATTWDTSTTVWVYGWTNVACNQTTISLSMARANKDQNTNRWTFGANQEISLGDINFLSNNPTQPEFCAADPLRPGMNAFRIMGVNVTGSALDPVVGGGIVAFPAYSGSGKLTIARATVNGSQENWPPLTLMCGETCSEQAGKRCGSGYVCKLNPGVLSKGVCVIPECANDNCTCAPPVRP